MLHLRLHLLAISKFYLQIPSLLEIILYFRKTLPSVFSFDRDWTITELKKQHYNSDIREKPPVPITSCGDVVQSPVGRKDHLGR